MIEELRKSKVFCWGVAMAASLGWATVAHADVSINKSFSPTTINPGDNSQLTISLFNSAGTLRSGAAFEDTLPLGMTIASVSGLMNGCNGQVTLDPITQKIKLVNGVIPAQVGTTPGKCDITLNVTSLVAGNRINNIPVGALTVASGESNTQDANATLSVNFLTTLSGTKTLSPGTVAPNGRSRLKITLSNSNFVSIPGTSYTDNLLPAGMTVATLPNPVFTCNNSGSTSGSQVTAIPGDSSFTVSGLTIPPKVGTTNGSCDLSIDVFAAATSNTYTNTIPAGAVTTSRGISNTSFGGTLTVENRARISKKFATAGAVNVPFAMTVSITNGSSVPLTNAGFVDILPTSTSGGVMTAVMPVVPVITCKNANGVAVPASQNTGTATFNGSSLQVNGLTIPASSNAGFGTCDVKVNVKVSALGTYNNLIPKINFTNTENVASTTDASATTTVSNAGTGGGGGTTNPVNISKSFGASSIAANGTSVLTIMITNPTGNQDLTGLSLTDNLPTGLTIASTPGSSNTCNFASSPTVTATANSTLLKITNGSLQAGTSCTFQANVTGTITGIYTNTIPANSLTTTNGSVTSTINSSAATATLEIIPGARITKSFNGNNIAINGISRLRINIENFQSQPLVNAAFTDPFTSGVKIAAVPDLSNTCGGTVTAVPNTGTSLSLSNGVIPLAFSPSSPGSCSIEVNVTKTSTGNFNNSIAANSFTSRLGNSTGAIVSNPVAATARLTAFANLDLGVNKSISPNNITGGSTATMTIRLTNNSTAATLSNVQFTDTMPSGMLIASQPNLVNSCSGIATATNAPISNDNGILKLMGGSIPAGSNCTISVNITSSVAGNLTNTIPINGVTSQEGAKNSNAASASITFLPFPGVSKSFFPSTIARGSISRLTVQISNFGTSPLTGASLSDQLPPNLSFAALPNTSTTCSNGLVTITTNTLQITGANIPAKSTCTFGADVTSLIADSYVNTIPANALTDSSGNTNPELASATLQVIVPPRPGVYLVKRITAINGQPATGEGSSLNEYIDVATNPYDDNNITIPVQILPTDPPKDTDRWPNISTFLLGGVSGGTVKPGDSVEYTIYFLSAGDSYAKNVTLCDLIPTNQSFLSTTYNGLYTNQSGTIGIDRGLLLFTGGQGTLLTNVADGDAGRYYAPGTTLPNVCKPTPASAIPTNTNGAVVFNLGNLPVATPLGSPSDANSYGYVRFRAIVR
jgi:uncharacterized repeat protein (TIGR01451 family)